MLLLHFTIEKRRGIDAPPTLRPSREAVSSRGVLLESIVIGRSGRAHGVRLPDIVPYSTRIPHGVRVFCFFYRSTHYSGFDEASATGEPANPDQSRSRDRR